MVRETRFSFDDEMNVNYPVPEEDDDEDLDYLTGKELPLKKPRPSRRERKRNQPGDRRPDRRHMADGDWLKRTDPHERPDEASETGEQPQS